MGRLQRPLEAINLWLGGGWLARGDAVVASHTISIALLRYALLLGLGVTG